MAAVQGPFLAAVLLLVSLGPRCSSPLPACPESCTCQRAPLLNCSSSGLSSVPLRIQDSVSELDLSHNFLQSVTLDRPHHNLRNVWLGNNSITHLSLCVERGLESRNVRGRHLDRLRPWSRRGCVSWAPTLQLLSVERNQLEQLPKGLEGSELLQVLQLSFNRISTLRPGDLSHLPQLKELHLQHNFITSLHPQMFQDLAQLRVLDLSFNKLTSLHPSMYLSLRNIEVDVRLGGNRWQCDCSMRSLRRRMAYDSSRGLKAWSVVCASPSILSGRDLLQLEEDDLNCFGTENSQEFHQDVTVYRGSEILLSCSSQDSTWWTPSGPASVSQPQASLLISDITQRDSGLYVCVSEKQEVLSVFNLQISKIEGARRKTRSLPRTSRQIISGDTLNSVGQDRNQRASQPNLALAVCLSVFITFLIAFVLGVLARPHINVLWRRVMNKKSSSATNSVSSVEQRQYDNEAFSSGEELQETGTHRERRVTFSTIDFREDNNVQYYDTVAGGDQESITSDAVIDCEAAEAEKDTHRAGDSGSENSLQQSSPEVNRKEGRDLSGIADAGPTHNMEFEHIPDTVKVEKERSLSSCSDSSLSDREFNEDQIQRDHTTPNSPQLAESSLQQRTDFSTGRKVEVSQITPGSSEIPGFSAEPFADWSPHINNIDPTDPDLWQENEEQFEFSDSVQSTPARPSSVFGSFNSSKQIVAPSSDKKGRRDTSSSSSYISEDEPTIYIVNSDPEEDKEDIERNHNKPEVINASFEQQFHSVGLDRAGLSVKEYQSVSQNVMKPQRPALDFDYVTPINRHLDITPSLAVDSSSSSDSEDETTHRTKGPGKVNIAGPPLQKSQPVSQDPDSSSSSDSENETMSRPPITVSQTKDHGPQTRWPAIDLEHSLSIKRRLDIKTPSLAVDSSSSSDSEDESTHRTKGPGKVNIAGPPLQKSQPVSQDPDSSSSSDSENETMSRPPITVSQTKDHGPQTRWPAIDLEHSLSIKRRLDIKTPSLAVDSSSSSDSEDETTHRTKGPGKVNIAGPPLQKSQPVSQDPDSSSSSDSENETMSRPPITVSQTKDHGPQTRWPAIDLEHSLSIKRRLDIKTPSLAVDSSSSSDSEDETTHRTKGPGKVNIAGPPLQKSQPVSQDPDSSSSSDSENETMSRPPITVSQTKDHGPQTRWPAIDLEHSLSIKRRLDIKTPSLAVDSSSSSDSEDESTHRTKGPGKVNIAGPPLQKSQPVSQDPDSSSSSDSENETMSRPPITVSQTKDHGPQTRWPAIDLEHSLSIKRRLDIKTPSLAVDSSSSSDSEDETTHRTKGPGKVNIAGPPLQKSQPVSQDPDSSSSSDSENETMSRPPITVSQTKDHGPQTRWPAIDLEHSLSIKRRLDIKTPSLAVDSSSSSDSEDETTHRTKGPGKVNIAGPPLQKSQPVSQDPDSSSSSDSEDETMSRPPITVSQTKDHSPQTRWPAIDLEHSLSIKRRLDIKTPSLAVDSSSSSDSEDESTHRTKGPGKVNIAGPPLQKSQPVSQDPDSSSSSDSEDETMSRPPITVSQTKDHGPQTRWLAIDLEHSLSIKRRLDIKTPSLAVDSLSSSDSEDETTHRTKGPGKVNAAGPPLQKSPPVSQDPDSSSSSDSEDETMGHTKKKRPGKEDTAGPAFQESQTKSHDPDTRWPTIDLERIPHVKHRLDIKAPNPPPDSSSSSDSEDETSYIKKPEQGKTHISRPPITVSQTKDHGPQTRWPAIDLEHSLSIKRRLDIKTPSLAVDSSSSSDSEDETTHRTKGPWKVNIAGPPLQKSQPVSQDPDSSSSRDSEDETMGHTKKKRPGKEDTAGPAFQESQTKNHDPDTRWPTIDLEHIPQVKHRLDIKVPNPPPDSSSSSDSEDETSYIKKPEQGKTHISRPPITVSQTKDHSPQTRWPAIDLEHSLSIKRRLDIKTPSLAVDSSSSSDSEDETTHRTEGPGKVNIAGPPLQKSQPVSQDPDSSSSSDSEDETMGHTKKKRPGKEDTAGPAFQESQTKSHDPNTGWPTIDLEHIPHVKHRLDIKVPNPPPDTSSSSDSEDETSYIKKPEQGKTHISRPPITVSQTKDHSPQTRWPAIDLEHSLSIKRRLDIKTPSLAVDSSSSSDSEDETTHRTKGPGKVNIAGPPLQKSQPVSQDPDSSSSSDSDNETMSRPPITVSQTKDHGPQTRWLAIDLENSLSIKRRLDIKTPSLAVNSSSSSDSEDETTHHTKMERPGVGKVAELPFQESQMVGCDLEKRWPTIDLSNITHSKRRLDIKAPSPPHISSHGSLLNSGSTNSTVEGRREEDIKMSLIYSSSSSDEQEDSMENLSNPVSTVEQDLDSRWPLLGLDSAPRVNRRLDIKARSPQPELSSSSPSNSDDESRLSSHTVKHEKNKGDVGNTIHEQQLHKRSLGVPHIHRRLDIKAPSPQPDPILSSVSPGCQQSKSNSSTSDSESESRGHTKLGLGLSATSKAEEKEFIKSSKTLGRKIPPISKTDHNITLEKYTLITDDMVDKTTNDNICTTPKINPELESRWATMNLGVSRFRKRLEITSHQHKPPILPSSPPPNSSSSSSNESGTGYKSSRTRPKRREVEIQGIPYREQLLTPENKPVSVSLSLEGRDDNSGDSIKAKERLRKYYSLPTTGESNSDTMLTGLGTPQFRRNLDIKVNEKAPAVPPQQQLSDSSSSSEIEDMSTEHEGKTWRGRYRMPSVTDKETSQNHMPHYETQTVKMDHSQDAWVEFKSQANGGDESDSLSPHLSMSNIPFIKRDLDIRAPLEKETSSSSDNSDKEMIDHTVPDLSHGVPRIKRRLNVKAQLSEPSNSPSSCSESENEVTGYTAKQNKHASNMTVMTNDSPVTYKRLIIKTSFPPSDSSPSSGQTGDHLKLWENADDEPYHSVGDRNASLLPRRVPSMSFDDVVKKRTEQSRHTSDVDLPPEIRWTGVGHQLSDRSIPSLRRHVDVGFTSPQQVSPSDSELSSPYSFTSPSNKSSDGIKQDREKADVTLMHKYPSFSVSPATSTETGMFVISSGSINETLGTVSEDRRGRKGLSALKAMSSERRLWDTQNESVDKGASPLFDDSGPQVDSSFNYERSREDIKPLARKPLTRLYLSSSPIDEKRATGLLYGIPHYRSHDFGSTEPPQEAPPPIPATPPPDEAVGLIWRSPQSSKKQELEGTRYYLQQSRKTEESDPSSLTSQQLAVYFDSSNTNISEV